jgi:excisionase family DNA binding protein
MTTLRGPIRAKLGGHFMSKNMEEAQGVGAGKASTAKPRDPIDLDCMRSHEVARKLGISHITVLRLMRSRRLPGVKIGRSWVVRKTDLESYLSELTRKIAEQRGIEKSEIE